MKVTPKVTTPKIPSRPHPMPFCERAFGLFFLLWGAILLIDSVFAPIAGRFAGRLEHYAPTWLWGSVFVIIAVARWAAYRFSSNKWRVWLSFASCIMLVIVAATAFSAGLWSATTPLAGMLAYIAFWCHSALLRDIRYGL